MPRNVEIKAKAHDLDQVMKVASALSGTHGVVIPQRDVFFRVKSGRLKLRYFEDGDSQLVYYERPDHEGPILSEFSLVKVANPGDLSTVLGQAIGIRGEVVKTRHLFIVGQTRVHCDRVQGLGDFVELEVMLEEGQSVDQGTTIAQDLMQKLGIHHHDLISGAYMDLIEQGELQQQKSASD